MFSSLTIKLNILLCPALLAVSACQKDGPAKDPAKEIASQSPVNKPASGFPRALFPTDISSLRVMIDGGSMAFITAEDDRFYDDNGNEYSKSIALTWHSTRDVELVPWSGEIPEIEPVHKIILQGINKKGHVATYQLVQDENRLIYLLGANGGQLLFPAVFLNNWRFLAQPDNRYLDKRLWPMDMRIISQLEVINKQSGDRFSWQAGMGQGNGSPVKNAIILLSTIGGIAEAEGEVRPLFSVKIQQGNGQHFSGMIGQQNGHFFGQSASGRSAGKWLLFPDENSGRLVRYLSALTNNGADPNGK